MNQEPTPWSLRACGDGAFEGQIVEGWFQGRGAFGGLQLAMAAEAMSASLADPSRHLRSLTLHCCTPVQAGTLRITPQSKRAGNRVTHMAVTLEQGGEVVAFGSASFGREREQPLGYTHLEGPRTEPPEALPPMPRIDAMPAFFDHVEARFCPGLTPFRESDRAEIAAWVRLRQPIALTAPHAVLLHDALPPGAFARLTAPRPAVTVDINVHLFEPLPRHGDAPGDPLLLHVESLWAGHGYADEQRTLFARDGAPIGRCRQLLALL